MAERPSRVASYRHPGRRAGWPSRSHGFRPAGLPRFVVVVTNPVQFKASPQRRAPGYVGAAFVAKVSTSAHSGW